MKRNIITSAVLLVSTFLLATAAIHVADMLLVDDTVYIPTAAPAVTAENPPPEPEIIAATESDVPRLVNIEREVAGVAPLKLHPNISKSAQLKAQDMWDREYRSHYLPGLEDSLITLTPEMAMLVDPIYISSSENITFWTNKYRVMSAEDAMEGWLESPPHKDAILSPEYSLTSIGVAGGNIVVQHFCVAY